MGGAPLRLAQNAVISEQRSRAARGNHARRSLAASATERDNGIPRDVVGRSARRGEMPSSLCGAESTYQYARVPNGLTCSGRYSRSSASTRRSPTPTALRSSCSSAALPEIRTRVA